MWYSSVRSNRSLRSPALSTSHTGGSPSHPRISQADAPPLPASASATFAPLRCARGFGPFAALTLGTRGRANTTAHRSAHYAPLCGLHTVRCAHSRGPHNTGWKCTLETQTRGVGTPQDQHRHRGALHGAEGLSVGRPHRRSTAWCAPAAARVGPGRLHAHAPVPARSSRYALHSLRLAATLVPASLPARRVRRLRIARLRSLRSGGPGGSVPQYRCAGPVPRAPGGSGSTIPSAARRHPRPSSRYRVCRRGGAASHLRCCPPSTRRTSGAVRVPFHPALRCARYPRPPPLKTTLVTRAGTRGLFAALTTRPAPAHPVRIVRCAHNPPNPTHPGYTGAPHRCSTSASLQPACAKPRTPVRTGNRAVRLPADSAPGFGTPVLTRGPTRTVRFAASSPRIKRPASLPDASLPDAQQERPMAAYAHTYWPGPARGRLRERSAALPAHRRCPSPTNSGTLSPWQGFAMFPPLPPLPSDRGSAFRLQTPRALTPWQGFAGPHLPDHRPNTNSGAPAPRNARLRLARLRSAPHHTRGSGPPPGGSGPTNFRARSARGRAPLHFLRFFRFLRWRGSGFRLQAPRSLRPWQGCALKPPRPRPPPLKQIVARLRATQ